MVVSLVALSAFGPAGGQFVTALMTVSILGALGGLIMTLPRLFYTMAAEQTDGARGPLRWFFARLGRVAPRTATPFTARSPRWRTRRG